jgi:hypothetical protein
LFFVNQVVFSGLLDTIHKAVGNLECFVKRGWNGRKNSDTDTEANRPTAVGSGRFQFFMQPGEEHLSTVKARLRQKNGKLIATKSTKNV